MEIHGGDDPLNHQLIQGPQCPGDRLGPIASPADHFPQQGVIKRRDHIAGEEMTVHADANPSRWHVLLNAARVGHEISVGILCINAAFDAVAQELDVRLLNSDPVPGGNPQLCLHEINAAHHLCDRMLHLYPGIHFHKIK